MAVLACNPDPRKLRQEDHKLEARLDLYLGRLCLKKQTRKAQQQ